jgi:hypothetical protein
VICIESHYVIHFVIVQNNPMSGPAHIVALANALERERRPNAYVRPPPTGGDQISVRLGTALLAHMDVIGQASGWTRVQVLTALIDRGLFDLYANLSDETGEAIMEKLANALVPTMQDESLLLCEVKRVAREEAGDGCTLSPGPRPEQFWILGQFGAGGIPRMSIVVDRHAASDFQNARPSQRDGMVERLRGRLAAQWREAMERAGTELHLRIDPGTLL